MPQPPHIIPRKSHSPSHTVPYSGPISISIATSFEAFGSMLLTMRKDTTNVRFKRNDPPTDPPTPSGIRHQRTQLGALQELHHSEGLPSRSVCRSVSFHFRCLTCVGIATVLPKVIQHACSYTWSLLSVGKRHWRFNSPLFPGRLNEQIMNSRARRIHQKMEITVNKRTIFSS